MWLGYQGFAQSGMMSVGPLIMAPVVDAEKCPDCLPASDGTLAEGTFLIVTAIFCLVSVIPYAILMPQLKVPRPPKVEPTEEELQEEASLKAYEEDEDTEHLRWVSLLKRRSVNKYRADVGKPPAEVPWRTFKEDQEDKRGMEGLMKIGREDMRALIDTFDEDIYLWENGDEAYREKRRQEVKHQMKYIEKDWSLEDKHKLGEWLGDYLSNGGWMPPKSLPRLWKTILAVAFPPLVKNKTREQMVENYLEEPVEVWQTISRVMTSLLVVDTSEQGRNEAATRFNIASFKPSQLF